MVRRPQAGTGKGKDPAAEAREAAIALIAAHPLFGPFRRAVHIELDDVPFAGLARVSGAGVIHLHPTRHASPGEWQWAIAHSMLHLGFEHHRRGRLRDGAFEPAWRAACCVVVNRFLAELKVGSPPEGARGVPPPGDEPGLARRFAETAVPRQLAAAGAAGPDPDLLPPVPEQDGLYEHVLAQGLQAAVTEAIAAAGVSSQPTRRRRDRSTAWGRALSWFISSYPLLGSLAAGFELVEDAEVCRALSVRVAAVSPAAGEIYVNPEATLDEEERRFVLAHELLHAGLRHDTRHGGRDPFLFNVACDYAINGWLYEMHVGALPDGALFDRQLLGMSAEAIYDRIAADRRVQRRLAKLATPRGTGLGDVLPGRNALDGEAVTGVDLDEFYRRALTWGLDYHLAHERGYLPAALEEEIRALSAPAIPWDVALAEWFDEHFLPLERRRSFARPSRRQSATPDVPRPSWVAPEETTSRRTFGVVLDTSGSMGPDLLGKGLGAIASYAASRDVAAVRVVFCDAAAYDAGYLDAAEIAGRVRVRGRGGTVLQPGVDLLENAPDFPEDGPILVVTDGACDRVKVRREHAFLVPRGSPLPFKDGSPIFLLA